MSTVFLIGNGFDLSCGMKTRYVDVYNTYCPLLESDTEKIQKFKKEISEDYKTWSDFEEGMAEYAKTLDSEDTFVECIKSFRNHLQMYLRQEEIRFNESIADNEELKFVIKEEMRKSILDFSPGMIPRITDIIKDINHRYGSRVNFISFNYTNTFDNLFKLAFDTDNIFHIHGQLDNFMIMGMDNEEQISANYTLTKRGKLAFIKPYCNDEIDPNKLKNAKEKIEKANIICAFGLSLGDSDLTWRNAILKSWGIQNPEIYTDKIHIPCGQKIFNIEEVIQNYNK